MKGREMGFAKALKQAFSIGDLDYIKILKRALEITWKYKSTWLFGFLAALFNQSVNVTNRVNSQDTGFKSPRFEKAYEAFLRALTPALLVVLVTAAFVLMLVGVFLTFLSHAALIGMVKDVEEKDETDISSGFRQGLSSWLQLFWIALVIWIPIIVLFLLVSGVLALPGWLLFYSGSKVWGIVILVAGIILGVVLFIVAAIPLGIINSLADRFRVIKKLGVLESIKYGFQTFEKNLGKFLLIWLILLAVGIGAGMVIFAVSFLFLIPVALTAVVNVFLGLLFAIPAILVMAFLGGILQVFTSAVWTLAYFEVEPLQAKS